MKHKTPPRGAEESRGAEVKDSSNSRGESGGAEAGSPVDSYASLRELRLDGHRLGSTPWREQTWDKQRELEGLAEQAGRRGAHLCFGDALRGQRADQLLRLCCSLQLQLSTRVRNRVES